MEYLYFLLKRVILLSTINVLYLYIKISALNVDNFHKLAKLQPL
jgi:hypothetical protein